MKVVFCGGGTGGHVYPALTVANALRGLDPDVELLYIGVRGKIDAELVAREGIRFEAVTAGPLRVGPLDSAKGAARLLAGVMQSLRLLRMFRPDAVFATGGYGSVGVGIAAGLLRLPLVLFLPDVAAGLAVRSLVRFSTRIAVAVEPAREAMASAKTVLTGYPVRPGFFNLDPAAAKQHFGLDPSLPTLLVTGGSTGASVINENVAGWIEPFLARNQLIHISGRADEAWLQERRHRLPEPLQQRYHLYPYLYEDMPLALAAADLAVMRAGASTLGELPATGLPAILVPGAFSDQLDNALYLEREGAALMQPQSRLQDLQSQVESLLAKPEILEEMRANLARLSHPDAADKLAQLIIEVAK